MSEEGREENGSPEPVTEMTYEEKVQKMRSALKELVKVEFGPAQHLQRSLDHGLLTEDKLPKPADLLELLDGITEWIDADSDQIIGVHPDGSSWTGKLKENPNGTSFSFDFVRSPEEGVSPNNYQRYPWPRACAIRGRLQRNQPAEAGKNEISYAEIGVGIIDPGKPYSEVFNGFSVYYLKDSPQDRDRQTAR